MVTELIGNAALWPAEQVINRLLATDAHALSLLERFEGKAIQVLVERPDFFTLAPSFPIRISFDSTQIRLMAIDSNEFALDVDARLSANASTFSKLLIADSAKRSLVSEDLEVEGDIQLVQDLFTAMNQIDIEWEDLLSPLLGDVGTNQLSQIVKNTNIWFEQSRTRMAQGVDDYLKEEARIFPTSIETENFRNSLDSLKLRIDRAEARVARFNILNQEKNQP